MCFKKKAKAIAYAIRGIGPYDDYQKGRCEMFNNINAHVSENAVVFVGDSITEGFPIGDLIEVHAYNRGISGDTADRMAKRMAQNVLSVHPRTIVMLIGTNDFPYGRTPQDIAADISTAVNESLETLPEVKIILQGVYPTRNDNTRKNEDIRALNALLSDIAERAGKRVKYVDLSAQLMDPDGSAKRVYFNDGLHPNLNGFVVIAKELNKYL